MHNRLWTAGWDAFVSGRQCEPSRDPVIAEYSAGLPEGDQLAVELAKVWERGFNAAHAYVACGSS